MAKAAAAGETPKETYFTNALLATYFYPDLWPTRTSVANVRTYQISQGVELLSH